MSQIRGEKEELILPHSDHHGTGNVQAAYFKRTGESAQALAAGKPVPVAPPAK